MEIDIVNYLFIALFITTTYSYNEVYTFMLYFSLLKTHFIAVIENNKKKLVIKPSSLTNKFARIF